MSYNSSLWTFIYLNIKTTKNSPNCKLQSYGAALLLKKKKYFTNSIVKRVQKRHPAICFIFNTQQIVCNVCCI